MEHLGPLIAQSLMRNVGGDASRSQLDKLSEPLKRLVVQHVQAKTWLEQALQDVEFPSRLVSTEDKSVFLKKIIGYVRPRLRPLASRRSRRVDL